MADPVQVLFRLVADAAARLTSAGVEAEEAMLDAELLAREALGRWDRAAYLTHEREVATPEFAARFATLVARRERREPLAYILGRAEFWGLELEITPDVLIPRPETELIVETALDLFRDKNGSRQVVDVGTGSGCLAIALGREFLEAQFVATDTSAAAIEIARRNAARHGVNQRIAFMVGDMLNDARNPELVVSNPPYVSGRDQASLQPEVRDFEPATALFGGDDGLDVIRRLVRTAGRQTTTGAILIFEFGFGQDAEVRALLEGSRDAHGRPFWTNIDVRRDLAGIPRVIVARRA